MELPPRARRIRVENMLGLSRYGTTSACAENTQKPGPRGSGAWNYLRVRGEYINYRIRLLIFMELPPRARRIPCLTLPMLRTLGTTSACAENTRNKNFTHTPGWNYLRVRGEYQARLSPRKILRELPPRARRIRRSSLGAVAVFGTTSACAENTVQNQFNKPHARNYLRVRGEYIMRKIDAALISELPPRARRIQQMLYAKAVMEGTTSACAENTVPRLRCRRWCGNYLRVRGEYRR